MQIFLLLSQKTAVVIIGVGTPITMLFQVFIRENPNALFSKLEWYKWLLNPKFYLVRDFYKCVHG